jgi:hypothetical protein
MMLSLSAAAKQVDVSKATIHRAVKSGRVPAVRLEDGSYQIDPAELARVYPSNGSNGSGETRRNTSEAVLKVELEGARQFVRSLQDQLADLRRSVQDQVDDLRRDRDGWRQQAEVSQRLLTDTRKWSWWMWLKKL